LAAIKREHALFVAQEGLPPYRTVYFGGGTPSLLSVAILKDLLSWVREQTAGGGLEEWSVEVNPGSALAEKFQLMHTKGVTRLSLGVQALNDKRLRWLGRRHTVAEAEAAYETARGVGFRNIGVDLIAGGAFGGKPVWRETLERVVTWGPEHVSVYALTVEEESVMARCQRGKLTRRGSDAAIVARLHEAQEILESAGYVRYEVSNYARPGYTCRHHIACWRGERYLGLGPAASSHVGLRRWTNRPDLAGYLACLEEGREPEREEEILSPETKAVERLIFGLRMTEGVDLREIAGEGGEERQHRWREVLERLAREGLTEGGPDKWRLTRRGLDFADAVAVELLP